MPVQERKEFDEAAWLYRYIETANGLHNALNEKQQWVVIEEMIQQPSWYTNGVRNELDRATALEILRLMEENKPSYDNDPNILALPLIEWVDYRTGHERQRALHPDIRRPFPVASG